MNRDDFNNLTVINQIEYFNKKLNEEDNNFNAICKSIGISKNTILSRFKNNGYVPGKEGQKIILFCKEEDIYNIKSEPKKTVKEEKNKTKANDPKELNLILKRLELLEKEVEDLKKKNLELANDDFTLNKFSGVTTTKTFKIDLDVYKDLEEILEKYNIYKKQDVVSSLLKYAIDNIK